MKKTDLVVKSNKLIEASMKFTGNEYKVITYLTGRINIDIEHFEEIEIKLKDLNSKCFMNSNNTHSTSSYIKKKYAYSFAEKHITIPKPDGNIKIYNWFSVVETSRNTITAAFSPRLKEFLLDTMKEDKDKKKDGFTKYKLENVLRLKTFYEIRLYELMKQYEKIGFRDISLKDLKFMLGIEENKFKRFTDFKEKILKKAIENINKQTDIKVKFMFEKMSNNNVEFKFKIIGDRTNRKIKEEEEKKELNEIKEMIENVVKREVNYHILKQTILSNKIKRETIELYINNWDKFDYKTKDDPVAYFLHCVIVKKQIPEKQIGTTNNNMKPEQATNFEQRNTDDLPDDTFEFIDQLNNGTLKFK